MDRHTYWHWQAQIAKASCLQIIKEAEKIGFTDGVVGEKNAVDKLIRDCGVAWLPRMHTVESILAHHGHIANASTGWNLDLSLVFEPVQIAKYTATGVQFYGLHTDIKWYPEVAAERKMTAIMLLSPPQDYEGGDLIVDRAPVTDKRQGTVIVFPSFYPHEVTPVTKGTRYSATCWIGGPKLR